MTFRSCTIATLGPSGTDSDALARTLSPEVELYPTFREAVERSLDGTVAALVPCGAGPAPGVAGDRWVDLNFEYCERLVIAGVLQRPTKTMCLARRRQPGAPHAIILHPATETWARRHAPDFTRVYTASKVEAATLCAEAKAELCIGSLDVVSSFPELEPLVTFQPTMVWTLFCRPELAPVVAKLVETMVNP